ncbi:unnamed protein product [Penicillium discolor]
MGSGATEAPMCRLLGDAEGARDRLPRVAARAGATDLGLFGARELRAQRGQAVELGEGFAALGRGDGGRLRHGDLLRHGLAHMWSACDPDRMARMLQVRNLPDEVHARLKERAAAERMSLSDYVARELEDLVRYRSNAEVLEASRARARAAGVSLTRVGILAARDRERDERE